MNRFTPVVASLLLLVVYPIFAQDISVEDTVNFDLRAIGQTQGAGVPNAIGAGAFIPLHKTSNAVTYVDIEAKANLDDRSGDSSIINTDVAGTTLSTSTRLGYRRLNESGQMYGVYAGYDTRELKAGPVDTNVVVTDPRTVDFQQAALGAEFVSNQWRFDVYALIPTGDTEQQLNSHYEGGALETYGADVGYQINDKTKVTVGYYHQNGDVGEASGSGASAGLNYDITNNLTAGLKVSYDDAFETRVMATINWSFADLFKGDEAQTEATTNTVMNTLNASPEQRDVRVHDCRCITYKIWSTGYVGKRASPYMCMLCGQ
ncbi:carbamoyl-phosphate synthase [Arenicellales bacterium nBUS_45]